jgi:hypothetical protein
MKFHNFVSGSPNKLYFDLDASFSTIPVPDYYSESECIVGKEYAISGWQLHRKKAGDGEAAGSKGRWIYLVHSDATDRLIVPCGFERIKGDADHKEEHLEIAKKFIKKYDIDLNSAMDNGKKTIQVEKDAFQGQVRHELALRKCEQEYLALKNDFLVASKNRDKIKILLRLVQHKGKQYFDINVNEELEKYTFGFKRVAGKMHIYKISKGPDSKMRYHAPLLLSEAEEVGIKKIVDEITEDTPLPLWTIFSTAVLPQAIFERVWDSEPDWHHIMLLNALHANNAFQLQKMLTVDASRLNKLQIEDQRAVIEHSIDNWNDSILENASLKSWIGEVSISIGYVPGLIQLLKANTTPEYARGLIESMKYSGIIIKNNYLSSFLNKMFCDNKSWVKSTLVEVIHEVVVPQVPYNVEDASQQRTSRGDGAGAAAAASNKKGKGRAKKVKRAAATAEKKARAVSNAAGGSAAARQDPQDLYLYRSLETILAKINQSITVANSAASQAVIPEAFWGELEGEYNRLIDVVEKSIPQLQLRSQVALPAERNLAFVSRVFFPMINFSYERESVCSYLDEKLQQLQHLPEKYSSEKFFRYFLDHGAYGRLVDQLTHIISREIDKIHNQGKHFRIPFWEAYLRGCMLLLLAEKQKTGYCYQQSEPYFYYLNHIIIGLLIMSANWSPKEQDILRQWIFQKFIVHGFLVSQVTEKAHHYECLVNWLFSFAGTYCEYFSEQQVKIHSLFSTQCTDLLGFFKEREAGFGNDSPSISLLVKFWRKKWENVTFHTANSSPLAMYAIARIGQSSIFEHSSHVYLDTKIESLFYHFPYVLITDEYYKEFREREKVAIGEYGCVAALWKIYELARKIKRIQLIQYDLYACNERESSYFDARDPYFKLAPLQHFCISPPCCSFTLKMERLLVEIMTLPQDATRGMAIAAMLEGIKKLTVKELDLSNTVLCDIVSERESKIPDELRVALQEKYIHAKQLFFAQLNELLANSSHFSRFQLLPSSLPRDPFCLSSGPDALLLQLLINFAKNKEVLVEIINLVDSMGLLIRAREDNTELFSKYIEIIIIYRELYPILLRFVSYQPEILWLPNSLGDLMPQQMSKTFMDLVNMRSKGVQKKKEAEKIFCFEQCKRVIDLYFLPGCEAYGLKFNWKELKREAELRDNISQDICQSLLIYAMQNVCRVLLPRVRMKFLFKAMKQRQLIDKACKQGKLINKITHLSRSVQAAQIRLRSSMNKHRMRTAFAKLCGKILIWADFIPRATTFPRGEGSISQVWSAPLSARGIFMEELLSFYEYETTVKPDVDHNKNSFYGDAKAASGL